MAGSFKPILDSTNNIITRNPRVQEQFDLPYLLRHDPARLRDDDGDLALCKLTPLDNDTCDVITSASMAGSFKTILDSNNNIITRNPRVQERF